MQVTVETTEGLVRRMTIGLPADTVEGEYRKRLQSMAGRVRVDGFRPGKAPFSVIERRYGGPVRQEVLGDLMTASFQEAAAKENLRPASMPRFEAKSLDSKSGVEFVAHFEVYPEVKIGDVAALVIERPVVAIAETDIDNMLQKLRKQRRTWSEAARPSQLEDRVTVDFSATVDGQPFAGGEGKDMPVILGAKQMLAPFETELTGVTAGQVREFDVDFPAEYGQPSLAGKKARFVVTVVRVEEPVLPELNGEFATLFGVESGGVDGLRAEVTKNMQRELDRAINAKVKNQVMEQLLASHTFPIPAAMVELEERRLADQMNEQLRAQGGSVPKGAEYRPAQFEANARRRVALGLILAELISQNALKPDREKVKAEIAKIASAYNDPQEVVDWYYQDRSRLNEVESVVLEDEVVKWVLDRAKVTDTKTDFDSVMGGERVG